MISRLLYKDIQASLFQGKTLVLYGARQVGKTTLVKQLLSNYEKQCLYISCENTRYADRLWKKDDLVYAQLIGEKRIIILDEAQVIQDIGLCIKILHDSFPDKQIIALWSSSFDLAQKISEPMTWRIKVFQLYPFAIEELLQSYTTIDIPQLLDQYLLYGLYPDIVLQQDITLREQHLLTLAAQYLYKDIYILDGIRKSNIFIKLLQLLALQIGSEVSFSELASSLWIHTATVEKYISVLEQAFVIFQLSAFSRNHRKEIAKSKKIYFRDVGIRNAILQQFAPISMRTDIWWLRENFMIAELIKHNNNHHLWWQYYFRRTYDQQEIDLIREKNWVLHAYEMKWNPKTKIKFPKVFSEVYEQVVCQGITKENFMQYIS